MTMNGVELAIFILIFVVLPLLAIIFCTYGGYRLGQERALNPKRRRRHTSMRSLNRHIRRQHEGLDQDAEDAMHEMVAVTKRQLRREAHHGRR